MAIFNPVKLSKQFDGAQIEVEAYDEQNQLNLSYENEVITIPDVDLQSSFITVRVLASKYMITGGILTVYHLAYR